MLQFSSFVAQCIYLQNTFWCFFFFHYKTSDGDSDFLKRVNTSFSTSNAAGLILSGISCVQVRDSSHLHVPDTVADNWSKVNLPVLVVFY